MSTDLVHRIDAWIVFIVLLVAVLSPYIGKAQAAAQDWLVSSEATPSPYDDMIARAVVKFLNVIAWIVIVIPRFTNGWNDVKRAREQIEQIPRPPSARRGGTALLVLLIVAPFLGGGCAATPVQRARTVLTVSGQAVVSVERIFTPRYTEVTTRALEQSETYEAYLEATRRWHRGAQAIFLAAATLSSVEGVLDGIDEGLAGDIAGTLACAGIALADMVTALGDDPSTPEPDGLVEIPAGVTMAIGMVRAVAGPLCAPPEATALAVTP
jgi:hypothetical protein